jgi:delta 1-pyrroline-5-carboxylate dehydrogenase
MVLSESQRRNLALWSLGLTFCALVGSITAWLFVDGYAIDWPLMGIMAATLASMGAVLAKPARPRLRIAFNAIAMALTLPFTSWVLWRIFA